MVRPQFNTRRLFARFGGPKNAYRLMQTYGIASSMSAVQSQSVRGRITADTLAALVVLSRRIGDPITVESYIDVEDKNGSR